MNLLYVHVAFVDVFSKTPQFLFQIIVFCSSRVEVVLRPIFVT